MVLTNFKLFTQSVGINDKQGVLTKAINKTDRVVLDYKKQMFSFEFAALNFRDASKIATPISLTGLIAIGGKSVAPAKRSTPT